MSGNGASFHPWPVFSVSPTDSWDTPGRRHQTVLVDTSAFALKPCEDGRCAVQVRVRGDVYLKCYKIVYFLEYVLGLLHRILSAL